MVSIIPWIFYLIFTALGYRLKDEMGGWHAHIAIKTTPVSPA
jgi:hypothetical protein